MRILFSPATDMTRYSVHPTAQRIPPPPPRCQSPQKYADDGPAAASSAGILGVEKRYGKPWRLGGFRKLLAPDRFDRRKAALARGQISTSPQLFKLWKKTTAAV
jgi:hypothetical protein